MENANNITRFETGNIYEMRYIGDSELRPQWICIKLTAKTATFKSLTYDEVISRRIKTHGGTQYILKGTYFNAPCIKATRVVG